MKKTAVVYARVSTRRQADEGLPVESQIDRCRRRAESLEAAVARVFRDDGISGTIEHRPQFQAAVEYCERHLPDFFVCWSPSRFARDRFDAIRYKRRLDLAGTRIVYVSVDIDRESDAGYLTEAMMEVMDEYYSRQVSADTRRSMNRNAERGCWNGGRAPFGYQAVPHETEPRRRRLVPEPTEAALVRRIYEARASGLGALNIARELNDAGASNRGLAWRKTSILHILRSQAVTGHVVFGRKRGGQRRPSSEWTIVKSHEAVIDDSLWARVQAMMDREVRDHSAAHAGVHLFTGLLRCGACGGPMRIETATSGTGKTYHYYNCRNALMAGSCAHRRVPAFDLDFTLTAQIAEQVFTRRNLLRILNDMRATAAAWRTERDQTVATHRREIAQREKANERLVAAIETGSVTGDPGLLVRRMNTNEEKIVALESEIQSIEQREPPRLSITEDNLDELREFLRTALTTSENPQKTRSFLSQVVERVILDDDVARIRYRPDALLYQEGPEKFASVADWLPGTGSNCRPAG